MNVLVACEESQRVCIAFRELGHNAYSCDIQECSGGFPEWHIQSDVLPLLNGKCKFTTCDGQNHDIVEKWDLIIAHPPCTYLTISGNRWFDVVKYGYDAQLRWDGRCIAICFFLAIAYADCDKIAIENPVGCMSRFYRKPDQIIQPFQFGDPYTKKTCLWLKGLPNLVPTDVLVKPECGWVNQSFTPDGRYGGFKVMNTSKDRSKTFPGIALAMADQWGFEEVLM